MIDSSSSIIESKYSISFDFNYKDSLSSKTLFLNEFDSLKDSRDLIKR